MLLITVKTFFCTLLLFILIVVEVMVLYTLSTSIGIDYYTFSMVVNIVLKTMSVDIFITYER